MTDEQRREAGCIGGQDGNLILTRVLRGIIAALLCLACSSSAAAGLRQDERDIDRLRESARHDRYAQYELGLAYATGRGVPQDERLAVEWWLKAAEQGLAEAQNALGVVYDDGTGVERDSAQARRWFQKAADQGHPVAQNNLAFMHEIGRGGPLDYDAALHWYRLSADRGWPAAQASLGLMYAGAVGVTRDLVQASAWFDVAVAGAMSEEQDRYRELRDVVQGRMTPAEIAEARHRSQAWLEAFARRQHR